MIDDPEIGRQERNTYTEFDRERSVRLSRIVAGAFGAVTIFALVWLGVSYFVVPLLARPAYVAAAVALAFCALLYGTALVFAQRRWVLTAASTIICSLLLEVVAAQLAWESAAGLSALVVAACGVYIISIALSGVLGNTRLMFVTAAVTSALSAVVCLVAPGLMGLAAPPDALLTWLTVSGEQWLAAILTYGASSLYVQALHDLGALRTAIERARQLDDLKDQFITNVNHELRTPIMALHGYVKLLKTRHAAVSDERRAALIDRADHAGDKVVALLSSILDVRQLESSGTERLTPEVVDVRTAVESAAALIDPYEITRDGRVLERDLRVDVPDELRAWGEPLRVQQILTNLLANAIKYSPEGSPVVVGAQVLDALPPIPADAATGDIPRPPLVEITVRDRGFGIPPDQMPLLFHRFVRLPRDLASATPGNGLGLHLSRALAEQMGGTVWAESSGISGEGTTLHVWLPLPPAEADSQQVAALPSTALGATP
ncbi:MAG TPA: HAMP domain-containing sensor histidine kinase [Ktedonobacterales bacterium]